MLYDLNLVWTPQTTQVDLERTLKFSKSLSYDVVALNHTFGPPIAAQVTNAIPQIGPVHTSFPQQPHQQAQTQQPPSSSPGDPSTALPTTLRRATILVSDPATNHRLPLLASLYDLLACRPTTDKAFAAACTSWAEISLISLDLSVSQPFRFRPKPCMAAVNRGVLFEVCYGQLLSPSTDARRRAAFIANVLELFRATKGRGIVLSSEARCAPGGAGAALRAPADVVNLFAVWGLGSEKGLEALSVNPRAVVVNEGLRKRGFRGVVDIVDAEGRIPGRAEGADSDGKAGKNNKQDQKKGEGGRQKPKQQHNNKGEDKQSGPQAPPQVSNGKRKHDGEGDHGRGGAGHETSLPVMSKRQAKKMKLAEKEKKAAESTTDTSR